MEIEYIDKGQDKYPENITDLMKLARKSQSGDSYSSSLIAVCILCKHKKVNSKFFRYIDLAIEQGDQSLPFFLDILFTEGYTEDGFKIEQSEELRFKYLLKRKSLSSISSVITLARNNSERQKKVIAAAKTNQLHPIYNELLCDLSELIENDDSKLFSYVDNLNSIYSFFLNNRHSLLAKPIALTEEEYMTHYTNIQAIHSMLRIPKNFSEYEEYRQKYPVLRLYNTAYMNDPEEGLYLFDCEELKEIVPYIEEERYYRTYIASFTTHKKDDLTMWRLYGQDGKGLSIVLPQKDYKMVFPSIIDIFKESFHSQLNDSDIEEKNILLYKVSYDCTSVRLSMTEKFNELKSLIHKNKDKENSSLVNYLYCFFAKASDEIRYLYKNPQYKTEKEFRYLSFHRIESEKVKLDEREIPHLYVETPPDLFRKGVEIVIGPKAEKEIDIKLDIEYRLKRYGFNDIKVSISKAKYR